MASPRSSIDSYESPPYPQWDMDSLERTVTHPHQPTERADQRNPVNGFEPISPQPITPQSAASQPLQTQAVFASRHSTSAPDLPHQRGEQITPNQPYRSSSLPPTLAGNRDLQPPARNTLSQSGPAFHQSISRQNSSAVYSSDSICAITPIDPSRSIANDANIHSRHELYASATSTTSTTPLPPSFHARRETDDQSGFDTTAFDSVASLSRTASDNDLQSSPASEHRHPPPTNTQAQEDEILPAIRSLTTRSDPGFTHCEQDSDSNHAASLAPTQQRTRSESPENTQAREERIQRHTLPLATRGDPEFTHHQRDINRVAGLAQPGPAQQAHQGAILPSYHAANPVQGDGSSGRRCAGVCDMLSVFIIFLRDLGGRGILCGYLCALAFVMALVYLGIYSGMYLRKVGSDE